MFRATKNRTPDVASHEDGQIVPDVVGPGVLARGIDREGWPSQRGRICWGPV